MLSPIDRGVDGNYESPEASYNTTFKGQISWLDAQHHLGDIEQPAVRRIAPLAVAAGHAGIVPIPNHHILRMVQHQVRQAIGLEPADHLLEEPQDHHGLIVALLLFIHPLKLERSLPYVKVS